MRKTRGSRTAPLPDQFGRELNHAPRQHRRDAPKVWAITCITIRLLKLCMIPGIK